MREWRFENGIEVYEENYCCSLHLFSVYNGVEYLGKIYPEDFEDMEECIKELDKGHDPITYNWSDGMGNYCSIDGWGEKYGK